MADVTKPSKLRNAAKNFTRFLKDVRSELRKVIWPNRQQLTNNTTTVLLSCFIVGAIIWVADYALLKLTELVFVR